MDSPNPYATPSSRVGAPGNHPIRWRTVVGYGSALFLFEVLLGILEPVSWVLLGYLISALMQLVIFAHLAFHQPLRPWVHGALAVGFSYLLGAASLWVLAQFFPVSHTEPAIFVAAGIASTIFALLSGVYAGDVHRRRLVGGA